MCAMFSIISKNLSPVAVHMSHRSASILTDKIVMDSHRQVILKKTVQECVWYGPGRSLGPGHCLEVTNHV